MRRLGRGDRFDLVLSFDCLHDMGDPVGVAAGFDKDARVQAGKLSWISPISARLLFVNRRGFSSSMLLRS